MLAPGVVLDGRYRLDAHLATGGMGDVWRATDTLLARTVAVKVLLPALLSDPGFDARFRAEARMLAALHHPGIVAVYDVGDSEIPSGARAPYLIMEYVDGQSLSVRLKASGQLGVAETLSIVAQAARALDQAHTAGMVHRDVKPGNLLLHADGTVTLVDFGVARSSAASGLTGTNAVIGTALYMAPEQATSKPVSGATDIYALGAVAYHCLAGRPPFDGDNPLQVAVRHLHETPPPLPDEIPAEVVSLVDRAMAKEPADRFPDAAAFADAAQDALAVISPDTDGDEPDPTMIGSPVDATTRTARFGAAIPPGVAGVPADGPATAEEPGPVPAGAVPAAAGPPNAGPGRRRLIGILGAVLIAGAALTAVFAFAPDTEAPPANRPTPSITVDATASADPEQSGGAEPTPDRTGGSGSTSAGPGPSASTSPSASATPPPSPTSEPTPPPGTDPTTPPPSITPPPVEPTVTPSAVGA